MSQQRSIPRPVPAPTLEADAAPEPVPAIILPPDAPLMFRTKEVAKLLSLSERKIQQMCKANEIQHRRFGTALRIPRFEVIRLATTMHEEAA
jgi:excisionase family DNA binding protein